MVNLAPAVGSLVEGVAECGVEPSVFPDHHRLPHPGRIFGRHLTRQLPAGGIPRTRRGRHGLAHGLAGALVRSPTSEVLDGAVLVRGAEAEAQAPASHVGIQTFLYIRRKQWLFKVNNVFRYFT